MAYSVKKAGVSFKTKVNVDPDLTGKAANFTLTYYDDAAPTTEIAVPGSFVESTSVPGLYYSPLITVATAGDYTFNISNSIDGLGNVSAPVVVMNASIDDIKDAVDAAQTDITAIKATTDLLNTTELENLSEQLTTVKDSVTNISSLLINKTTTLTFNSDETANLVVGDNVIGANSGALGEVTSSTYDGTNTVVEVGSVIGSFVSGETVTGTGTTSAIGSSVEANDAVDSVLEFVAQIDDALSNGTDGLSVLAGFTDNLELMLEGKAYTDTNGNAVSEADSKGLSEIFAEIVANGVDITTANAAIATLTTNVNTLQSDVTAGFSSIESSVSALRTSVENKIDAVKTVVDSNSAVLLDAGYGNSALKSLIDSLSVDVSGVNTDTDLIISKLDNATYGLSALQSFLASIDAKLDVIDGKIDTISSSVSTTAHIFI